MKEQFNPGQGSTHWLDWHGNNIAVQCPVCDKVYIVSSFPDRNGRRYPHCNKSSCVLEDGGKLATLQW
jgi:hypothetical protein